jgi:hypothetical protein
MRLLEPWLRLLLYSKITISSEVEIMIDVHLFGVPCRMNIIQVFSVTNFGCAGIRTVKLYYKLSRDNQFYMVEKKISYVVYEPRH